MRKGAGHEQWRWSKLNESERVKVEGNSVQHQQFVNLISGFSVIFWVFQVAGNPEISKPRNL